MGVFEKSKECGPPAAKRPAEAARGSHVKTTMTHLAQIDDAQIRFNNEKVGIYRGFASLDGGANEQTCEYPTGHPRSGCV